MLIISIKKLVNIENCHFNGHLRGLIWMQITLPKKEMKHFDNRAHHLSS